MFPLHVFKASAGSGKTFQLAKQYIKLVVSNPQSYRNILAVTFTNKATEEMKMRILSQLYGIWKMEGQEELYPESKAYRDEVCHELQASPAFVSQRAGMALSNLLHNYNDFRVQTIDTFFQSILRNLARELDLTANLRIGLNDAQVEEMAVDQLIDDLKTTDAMLQWIMKYIIDNISDDRSWNVIGQIKSFGKTIFRDYYKSESRQLNRQLSQPGFFDAYSEQLRTLRQSARERMAYFAQQFQEFLDAEGFSATDLSNKERGIAAFFKKLSAGQFDETAINQTVANCLESPSKWYTKTHPRRAELHVLAESRLIPLLRNAVDECPKQWKVYQSSTLTLRHLSQLRLLDSIEQKVRELNGEANRFLLSDTQQLLATLISDSDAPFIFEKTGTMLEHIMIDEFLDTSTIQWQNFRVLLQETMSRRDSENLIVGDVKQSIYRWRSGDWRLLNNIEQQFPPQVVKSEPLAVNRRSVRRIVQFNSLFFVLAEALERLELSDMPEAVQLQRAYSDVVQQVPDGKPDEGYVSIRLLAGKADDSQEQMLAAAADAVSQLLAHGVPQSKIAILVRVNRLIPLLANYFAVQMPTVRIISDEAFRLDASTAVCSIVAALRLLTHPADDLTRAYLEKTLPDGIPHTFTHHASELLSLPLYELTERLFDLLGLNRLDDQAAYVCAFYDQLATYVAECPSDIDSFLREWEETICAKTIQSDVADGIRLISIHKSKGLEFENVIIPFCDWQLEKQSGNVLWCHPNESPYDALPVVPVDYSRKGMMGTVYETAYRQEHLQNVVDNLNLLYVAFTRARERMFVLGRRGVSGGRSAIIEQVLPLMNGEQPPRELIPEDRSVTMLPMATVTGTADTDQDLCFTYGTLDDYAEPEVRPSANVFLQNPEPIPVSISPSVSRVEFRQSNQSLRFTEPDGTEPADNNYIRLGNVLHHVFSTIRTTDDITPVLQRLQAEGVLDLDDASTDKLNLQRLTSMLHDRLSQEKVSDWFSPRWTLFNECPILTIEDGIVTERRPDRVMTDGSQWVVVDFKFARPDEEHLRQVRHYMELLHQMGHEHISGYLWYVYTNQIVPC